MILDGQSLPAITAAAQALQRGDLLGLPTETVYGLAADAGNDAAVAKIFAAKGRPSNHPLIVHVANPQSVTRFASAVPVFAQKLMDAFWPGPLTLILPRRSDMAAVAAGGQNSVGLRCPAHAIAQAVLQSAEALGVYGVAAPSANLFGRVSPTTAAHVASEFGPDLLIVDGGACAVGIESTIVDCTRAAPVLLRPGVLTPEQLSAACGVPVVTPQAPDADAPRASGTLASHYAPHAQVRLMTAVQMQEALRGLAPLPAAMDAACDAAPGIAIWARSPLDITPAQRSGVALHAMPQDPAVCAHHLFAQLRSFDAQGVAQIWVEIPPFTPAWDGVRDRLTRAATPAR
ncbi:L-threonylcarbamoyladenylate synthase [Limnohabitans sp.]|uniref:L-threonylcarbamoyladenylate synthase n=1 Tax=Limnohabitans sp. TaxID=1907725 RepID=UPI00286F3C2C|nr:L-threonylcarbamoyladenylate synthase [Limnohabitans sp.]